MTNTTHFFHRLKMLAGLSFLTKIVQSVFSISSTTMSTDSDPFLATFSATDSKQPTTLFYKHYESHILLSSCLPEAVMRRFMVKTITLNKDTTKTSQHEFLAIEVYDSDLPVRDNSQTTYLIFLERLASNISPDSTKRANRSAHDLLRNVIQSLPVVSQAGQSTAPADQEQIPLIHLTQSSESLATSKKKFSLFFILLMFFFSN